MPRMQYAQWAMHCHVIRLDTTVTIYRFYEIEKNKVRAKRTNRKRKIKNNEKRNCRSPPLGMGQTLEKNELEKEKEKTQLLVDRVRLRTKGKQYANQNTKHPPGSGSSSLYE